MRERGNPGMPKNEGSPERKKIKIPIRTLDLSKAWDTPSQAEIIFGALRKMGINPEDCVYGGFDGEYLKLVVSTGTHSTEPGIMFCSDCADLKKESGHTDPNALDFAFDNQSPALAVYDLNMLEFTGSDNFYEYKIKEGARPEQLIKVIFKLK